MQQQQDGSIGGPGDGLARHILNRVGAAAGKWDDMIPDITGTRPVRPARRWARMRPPNPRATSRDRCSFARTGLFAATSTATISVRTGFKRGDKLLGPLARLHHRADRADHVGNPFDAPLVERMDVMSVGWAAPVRLHPGEVPGYLSSNLTRRLSAVFSVSDLGKRLSHSAQNSGSSRLLQNQAR